MKITKNILFANRLNEDEFSIFNCDLFLLGDGFLRFNKLALRIQYTNYIHFQFD